MWSDHDFGIDRDNSQFGRIIQHLTDGAEDPTVAFTLQHLFPALPN